MRTTALNRCNSFHNTAMRDNNRETMRQEGWIEAAYERWQALRVGYECQRTRSVAAGCLKFIN